MATIERDVSLLQRRRVAPIYIVYGSAVQIRLNMIDYTIPANATVEFFAQCGSGPVYRCGGTASGNSAAFTPPEGFFRQGDNALQLEINGRMIPLAIDVKCEERISGVGSEETPEQVRPLVLQAQEAAKEASSAATRATGSASAAAGSASAAAKSETASGNAATAAGQSANAAAGSAASAGQSANAAAGSASAALGSQNAAAGSAKEALTSKNAAASSADSAAGSASSAAGSAGAAAGSAQEALASQNAAAGSAQAAQEALEKTREISVNPSYIGDNGNWFVWDTDQDSYVDSGVKAQGPKGEPGAVQTVCGAVPDASGNVSVTAENVGALPLSGGDMTGSINMNGHPVSGLNDPTGETQAARKGYVDASVRKAAHWNLLDNSDFRNPVNQRGETNYTAAGYTIDRWNINSNISSMDVKNGYIAVTSKSGANGLFRQYLESELLFGKTVTFAVKVKDGDLLIASGQYPASTSTSEATVASKTSSKIDIYITAQPNQAALQVRVNNGGTVNLEWAALYEGEYTADTLPEYRCKGYGAELAECQRYCLVIDYSTNNYITGYVVASTTTRVNAYFPLPVPMRTTPSLSSTDGSVWAVTIDGTAFAPTEAAIWFMSVNAILGMRFFFSSEIGLRKTGVANYNSGTKLILSADL